MGNGNTIGRDFTFIAISDIHTTDTTAGRRARNIQDIKNYIGMRSHWNTLFKAILMIGDLTDGSTNSAISSKQCQQFINNWYFPLERTLKLRDGHVRCILGNHDAPSKQNKKPQIVSFVKNNVAGVNYDSFDIEGIHFASVYLHPAHWDSTMLLDGDFYPQNLMNSLVWLAADLFHHRNMPIVLFWHFNITGPFSDWWFPFEHSETYKLIKDYRIEHVFTGHNHSTFSYYWGAKRIKTTCCGAVNPIVIADVVRGTVNVKFWNGETGLEQRWEDRLKDDASAALLPSEPNERFIPDN